MTYKNLTIAEHTALLNKMNKAYMPKEEKKKPKKDLMHKKQTKKETKN